MSPPHPAIFWVPIHTIIRIKDIGTSRYASDIVILIYICIMIYMKPIPGFEGYHITREGEVYGKRGQKITPFKNSRGYINVGIYRGGKIKMGVHRLLALTYIPTDDITQDVDHINNNPSDNRLENLQWLTRAQNVKKGFTQGRVSAVKKYNGASNMIFYITKENEARLRAIKEQGGSMSGLVNELLEAHFNGTPTQNTPSPKNIEAQNLEELHDKVIPDHLYPEKNASEPNGSGVSDLFTKSNLPDNMQLEQPCCANEFKPCKHWVWDVNTGDGYKNSLSGRYMEVE